VIELKIYPKKLTLRDGSTLTLRPMTREDEGALLNFFLSIPESERWFLKEDVTSPAVIRRWAETIDYRRALPLLAFTEDGRVVADAALIRHRGGSRSHLGEIRIVVAEEFRNRGLGVSLIRELCDIANDAGLDRVIAEVVSTEEAAIQAFEWLGFYRLATLEGMARDPSGQAADVIVMVMPLGKYYEWSKF
jgi:RimJ/RimL family protein N-acetyltransferase